MTATGTEGRLCELIAKRQQLGIVKYQTTIEANQLPLSEWLNHALEESLDHCVYLLRSIEDIDKQANQVK